MDDGLEDYQLVAAPMLYLYRSRIEEKKSKGLSVMADNW